MMPSASTTRHPRVRSLTCERPTIISSCATYTVVRPAGGTINIELATNRGCTTFSFNGQYATKYIDGYTGEYDDNWVGIIISVVDYVH